MSAAQYDVAVIGAGPAGSAAAYFLAKGGLRVVLLDKSDFPRDKTCGDGLTLRALAVLDSMGILSQVEERAFHCSGVTIRNSDEVSYRLEFSRPDARLKNLLILPRYSLDELLVQHAIVAGAIFMPHTKAGDITNGMDGGVNIQLENGQKIESRLAVIATGANIGLLRTTGLLKQPPPTNLAARVYFENVESLDDTIVLFFDGVKRPGYGWIFPTSASSANIGCGAFFDSRTPQPTQLRQLLESNTHLRRLLRNARQVGPIKGHPLRTDFSSALSGAGPILVVGEALGLVNPITGEGIDYALESAKLAADAILGMQDNGLDPTAMQRHYRSLLNSKFRLLFMFSRLIQRVYMRDGILDKALIRIRQKPHLQKLVVDACYGLADPISAFTPRTLWDLLIP